MEATRKEQRLGEVRPPFSPGASEGVAANDSPSRRAHHGRLAGERVRQLREFARTERLLTFTLLASTVFAWENYPRIIPGPAPFGQFVGGGDTVGVLTVPAGPLVIILALSTLAWSSRVNSGRSIVGWLALSRGLLVFGVVAAEIFQLLLGRRNWEDHHTTIANPALANAVGTGVWLALASASALVVWSLAYLWHSHHSWRDGVPSD